MNQEMNIQSLKKTAISRVFAVYLVMGLAFFLPAGTLRYWEAWAYILTILIPMMIFGVYMFRHDPKFLERRMRTREKRKEQRLIIKLGSLPFLLAYLMPGFDRRFGWSDISPAVTSAGLTLVLIGYLMTLYVFLTNSWASRVVEVEKEQKVITTGPYARVRHPMYSSIIIFYGATPVALGSWWALIPALLIIPVLIVRILDEEKELSQNLAGYKEYAQKVRRRLIPGVW